MILSVLIVLVGVVQARPAEPEVRPHVLLIMTDDMGWSDLHCQAAHTQH